MQLGIEPKTTTNNYGDNETMGRKHNGDEEEANEEEISMRDGRRLSGRK
jgi:hypothetical protein